MSSSFGLLFGQNTHFEDLNLDFRTLWRTFFTIFWHYWQNGELINWKKSNENSCSHFQVQTQNIRNTSKQQLQRITEREGVCVVTPSEHACLSGSKTREFSITCVFLLPQGCQTAPVKERKQEIRKNRKEEVRKRARRRQEKGIFTKHSHSLHCHNTEKHCKVIMYTIKHTAA